MFLVNQNWKTFATDLQSRREKCVSIWNDHTAEICLLEGPVRKFAASVVVVIDQKSLQGFPWSSSGVNR